MEFPKSHDFGYQLTPRIFRKNEVRIPAGARRTTLEKTMSEQAVFQAFDPDAELEISVRDLPHWFQPGVAIFVTFRTFD